jgi:ribose 5-phosphate isomerase B
MRVAVASDHAGFELKEVVRAQLAATGHTVLDLGTDSPTKPDDYPDFARAIGEAIVTGKADRGVLVCGSGVGASVAANKVPGVRAGLCHDHYSAHQGVEHDDMNVLVLGARVIGVEPAKELVSAFLAAKFTGEERHARRLKKVIEIERNPPRGAAPHP